MNIFRRPFAVAQIRVFVFMFSLLAVSNSACTTPANFSNQPLSRHDANTQYSIEEASDGFGISVLYTRYQFIPESDAILAACKQALTSLAYDLAERRDREIRGIAYGPGGLSGVPCG
jgi:hypothetical protein